MQKPKKRLIIFGEALDAWLIEQSKLDGISVSELIRRILDEKRKHER